MMNKVETKKSLKLREYLHISHYGSTKSEYKIKFNDQGQFYEDIKNVSIAYWDFGYDAFDDSIELANIVSSFVKPHLPPYTDLVIKTIYLKYQRQERPTIDCMADLFSAYINQFNYDFIEVPYIHNYEKDGLRIHPKIKIYNTKTLALPNGTLIFPDQSAPNVLPWIYGREEFRNKQIICKKTRNVSKVSTIMYLQDTEYLKTQTECCIVDDIIGGGDSILNVVYEIRKVNPNILIIVHCIFLMSEYGLKKLHDNRINVVPLYYINI